MSKPLVLVAGGGGVIGGHLVGPATGPREQVIPLQEEDAYPARPEGYGWEKLFSEGMCRHFREDFGLCTRVARFHNAYGPYGTGKATAKRPPPP